MSAVSQTSHTNRPPDSAMPVGLIMQATPKRTGLDKSTRYLRWFCSDQPHESPPAHPPRRDQDGRTPEEIAEVTHNMLLRTGDRIGQKMLTRLPPGHKVRRALRSAVLVQYPQFGACKFGEVVTETGRGVHRATQMFFANFDGALDLSGIGDFLTPVHEEEDRMFYGIHVLVDQNGNLLDFDRERGRGGIAFRTKNADKALLSIAAIGTGLSLEVLLVSLGFTPVRA